MKKIDERRYNRKIQRDLAYEMDLWIEFQRTGEPVHILDAVADPRKGYWGDTYNILYSPCDYDKDNPFVCVHEISNILEYFVRSSSLQDAKKKIKQYHSSVKFVKPKQTKGN